MPGIPGIGALMFIFIEQQLAGCEQQPPLQASASLAQHMRPQQPRTDVATSFNMRINSKVKSTDYRALWCARAGAMTIGARKNELCEHSDQ